jgi:flagellar motility protein MotE (MotC chaperone)
MMAARRGLVAVLVAGMLANGLLLIDALSLGWIVPVTEAQATAGPASGEEAGETEAPKHPAEQGPEIARATYRRLIDELSARKSGLEERAEELAERERQVEVVRQELATERTELEALREKVRKERQEAEGRSAPSFDRLLKAYEGMEPENAAAALSQLYQRDREVVVDVLLGLRSRQAAAVLDAVAAQHPQIAAELSLEIWQKDPRRRD